MLSHGDNCSQIYCHGLEFIRSIYISILKMKCINHAGKRLGTALGALAKKVRRYCPDDAIS